jgi:hypothetical protein
MLLACAQDHSVKSADTPESSTDINEDPENYKAVSKLVLKPYQYVEFCEDPGNGLKITKTIGDFSFSAFYKPANYLALRELPASQDVDPKAFSQKLEEYGDLTYFTFKIENPKAGEELLKVNAASANEYYGRLEYMAFKMQEDFKLLQDKDTLNCNLFHFERVYGLAPSATFVLAFPKINAGKDVQIWYHDKIFKNGIIIMNIKTEVINNLPKLEV